MLHQESFQTLVGRYERVHGRVRDLVASAEVANAKLAAMQIRIDNCWNTEVLTSVWMLRGREEER